MSEFLDRIRIVLVNTSHPGNIGAAARAMKTMGLSHLYLVSPIEFPHQKAIEMASGAGDILEQAILTQSLDEALEGCHMIIGTSARMRTISWPLVNPRQMVDIIQKEPNEVKIAILFGREQTGLTNEELQRCHLHMQIPANPEYSSLNLGAAVQVIGYELQMALSSAVLSVEAPEYPLATADAMQRFFQHLEETLIELEFLKLNAPRKLMTRLRRFFLRARPDVMEMNILRGILTAIKEKGRRNE